jgi:hypothetical protein
MYNDKIVKENEQNMERIRTTLIFQIHKSDAIRKI